MRVDRRDLEFVVPAQAGTPTFVIPAKAGIQCRSNERRWGPACAGTTIAVLGGAFLLFAVPAQAAEIPKRKSGQWEITTSQAAGPAGPTVTMCIDEKLDDVTRQMASGAITCSKQDLRREGDRYVADSVCKIGDSTATTRAVFTGTFDASYQADIQATYSPPLMGMSEGRSTMSARWLGPCKAGQRPGDITMPTGQTINFYDTPAGGAKKK